MQHTTQSRRGHQHYRGTSTGSRNYGKHNSAPARWTQRLQWGDRSSTNVAVVRRWLLLPLFTLLCFLLQLLWFGELCCWRPWRRVRLESPFLGYPHLCSPLLRPAARCFRLRHDSGEHKWTRVQPLFLKVGVADCAYRNCWGESSRSLHIPSLNVFLREKCRSQKILSRFPVAPSGGIQVTKAPHPNCFEVFTTSFP